MGVARALYVIFIASVAVGVLVALAVTGLRLLRGTILRKERKGTGEPAFTLEQLFQIREGRRLSEEEFMSVRARAVAQIEEHAPSNSVEEFFRELKKALERGILSEEEYRRLQERALERGNSGKAPRRVMGKDFK